MTGFLWLALLHPAAASGLLYDGGGYVPLTAVDLAVAVDGRMASGLATYTFDPADPGQTFATALPDGAAVTSLRVQLDGTWIDAAAAPAVAHPPAPDGPVETLLPGDAFVAALPGGSAAPIVVEVGWQALLAARDGGIALEVPLTDGGLGPTDPAVQWSAEVVGIGALLTFTADPGTATLDAVGHASGAAAMSAVDALTLSWTEAPTLFGIDVRAYRPALDPYTGTPDPDGYALITVLPGAADADVRVDAITTFVLDASASMQGRPMHTAVAAASDWLRALPETDRFNLVPYTSVAVPYRGHAPLATEGAVDGAIAFLERQQPSGLSDPADGLVTALSLLDDTVNQRSFFSCAGTTAPEGGPPVAGRLPEPVDGAVIAVAPYVVWITDGGATSGQTDTDDIASEIGAANGLAASIYAVGVGDAVDRALLERIAGEHRGEVRYAETVGQVPDVVASLRAGIADPVLVRPEASVSGWVDPAPAVLPDVAAGTEVVLAFRYAEPGETALVLTGIRGRDETRERFAVILPEQETASPSVARAWAQLRVADLDARYLAGETGLYGEISALVGAYGVSSDVVTLSFAPPEGDRVADDAMAMAAESADVSAGCGCASPIGLAGGFPLSIVAVLAALRRRPTRRAGG